MKSGPAMGWRPRKRRLQQPDANLTLPHLPQVTGQQGRQRLDSSFLNIPHPGEQGCYP